MPQKTATATITHTTAATKLMVATFSLAAAASLAFAALPFARVASDNPLCNPTAIELGNSCGPQAFSTINVTCGGQVSVPLSNACTEIYDWTEDAREACQAVCENKPVDLQEGNMQDMDEFVLGEEENPELEALVPKGAALESCPGGIETGQYYLANDLVIPFEQDQANFCINDFGADAAVQIDCNGHAIIGHGQTDTTGIAINQDGSSITNCRFENLTSPVRLTGENQRLTNSTFTSTTGDQAVFLSGRYSSVENNNIEGSAQYGIAQYQGYGNNISENAIRNTVADGIYIRSNRLFYNGDSSVINNVIENSSGSGIYVLNTDQLTINDNRLTGNKFGIFLRDSYRTNVLQNLISQNERDGIYIQSGQYDPGAAELRIVGNTIEKNGFAGVSDGMGGSLFQNNVVRNNRAQGIEIRTGASTVLRDNTFIGNGAEAVLLSAADDSRVEDNVFEKSQGSAISISNGSDRAYVTNNQIENNAAYGIRVSRSTSSTILRNQILTGGYGIKVEYNSLNTLVSGNIVRNSAANALYLGISPGGLVRELGVNQNTLVEPKNTMLHGNVFCQSTVKDVACDSHSQTSGNGNQADSVAVCADGTELNIEVLQCNEVGAENASLSAVLSDDSPKSMRMISDGEFYMLANWRLTPSEKTTLHKLVFRNNLVGENVPSNNGGADRVRAYKLTIDGQDFGERMPVGPEVTFDIRNLVLKQNQVSTIVLSAAFNQVNDINHTNEPYKMELVSVDATNSETDEDVLLERPVISHMHVVHRTLPTLAFNQLNNVFLQNGLSQYIYSFSIAADDNGPVSVRKIGFALSGVCSGGQSVMDCASNFELTDLQGKVLGSQAEVNLERRTVILTLDTPITIGAGNSRLFGIRADLNGFGPNNSILTRLVETDRGFKAKSNSPEGVFVWSDNSGVFQSLQDAHWFSGFGVDSVYTRSQGLFSPGA